MRAVDFLEQYSKLNLIIQNNLKEAEKWRAIAAGTTTRFGTDRVQTSGNPDKMADAIGKYVELERKAEAENEQAAIIMQDIIDVLKQLNANQYDLLYKKYIDGIHLKAIAGMKKCSHDSIRAAHRRAIKNVQCILDARET